METRGRPQDGNEDGSGNGNESSNGDGNGDAGEDGIREGVGEVNEKPHESCRHDRALSFPTCHHLCRQGVALAGTRQLRSQGPVSVHAHCTGGGTGSEGREGANGVGGGNGDGSGDGA